MSLLEGSADEASSDFQVSDRRVRVRARRLGSFGSRRGVVIALEQHKSRTRVASTLPASRNPDLADFPTYLWPGWDHPMKIRAGYRASPGSELARENRCEDFDGRPYGYS